MNKLMNKTWILNFLNEFRELFDQGSKQFYNTVCNFAIINFFVLGVQLCFRRFSIDDFSGKWWSK